MGIAMTILHSVKNALFMNISGVPYEDQPISYERSDDYTIHGMQCKKSFKSMNNFE